MSFNYYAISFTLHQFQIFGYNGEKLVAQNLTKHGWKRSFDRDDHSFTLRSIGGKRRGRREEGIVITGRRVIVVDFRDWLMPAVAGNC